MKNSHAGTHALVGGSHATCALTQIRASKVLRVGYAQSPSWSYARMDDVLGRDIALCRDLAAALRVDLDLVEREPTCLAEAVIDGAVHVAVGGLVDEGQRGLACIAARRSAVVDTGTCDVHQYRRALYPNAWWIRQNDVWWNLRIRWFLLARQFKGFMPSMASTATSPEHRGPP